VQGLRPRSGWIVVDPGVLSRCNQCSTLQHNCKVFADFFRRSWVARDHDVVRCGGAKASGPATRRSKTGAWTRGNLAEGEPDPGVARCEGHPRLADRSWAPFVETYRPPDRELPIGVPVRPADSDGGVEDRVAGARKRDARIDAIPVTLAWTSPMRASISAVGNLKRPRPAMDAPFRKSAGRNGKPAKRSPWDVTAPVAVSTWRTASNPSSSSRRRVRPYSRQIGNDAVSSVDATPASISNPPAGTVAVLKLMRGRYGEAVAGSTAPHGRNAASDPTSASVRVGITSRRSRRCDSP